MRGERYLTAAAQRAREGAFGPHAAGGLRVDERREPVGDFGAAGENLDAQRALFNTQQALIAAQLARQQAHIGVYKALGGGWVAQQPGVTSGATTAAAQPVTP